MYCPGSLGSAGVELRARPGLEVDMCGAALGEVSTGLSGRGGGAGGPELLSGCGRQADPRPVLRMRSGWH